MKIAILTFSHAINRGAHMQCYALSRVLRNLGHSVEIIHIELPRSNISLKGRLNMFFTNMQNALFRAKFYPAITKTYHSAEELRADSPKADLFIVGSDQVWNPDLTKGFGTKAFFFDFIDDSIKRISYAASFGKSVWDETKDDNTIRGLLKKFNAISLREQDAIDICKETFGIDTAKVVLDPVFLLENYDSIVGEEVRETNSIVYYPLCSNKETKDVMLALKDTFNCPVISYSRDTRGAGFRVRYFTHIVNWLKDIRSAKVVVTNSFHCMAFCIIFNKQFIVTTPHKGRENRILSILTQLGIEDRYVSSIEDFRNREYELLSTINYTMVNTRLNSLRSISLEYLQSNLK